jgi:type III restriction enzyme
VGRGLRLAVDQNGDRQDDPALVQDVNVLTIVASESYLDFALGLEKELGVLKELKSQPLTANDFEGLRLTTALGPKVLTLEEGQRLFQILSRLGAFDGLGRLDLEFLTNLRNEPAKIPADLAEFGPGLWSALAIFSPELKSFGPFGQDDRKRDLDDLIALSQKKRFLDFWAQTTNKTAWRVELDSDELVAKISLALKEELRPRPLTYFIQKGAVNLGWPVKSQTQILEELETSVKETLSDAPVASATPGLTYDLIGELASRVFLTRKTVARLLSALEPEVFAGFANNPEAFLADAGRIINERKGSVMALGLKIDPKGGLSEVSLFALWDKLPKYWPLAKKIKTRKDPSRPDLGSQSEADPLAKESLSETLTPPERPFVVGQQLPGSLRLATPVGKFAVTWVLAQNEAKARYVYFVAETKGELMSLKFSPLNGPASDLAERFFATLADACVSDQSQFKKTISFGELLDLVGLNSATQTLWPEEGDEEGV